MTMPSIYWGTPRLDFISRMLPILLSMISQMERFRLEPTSCLASAKNSSRFTTTAKDMNENLFRFRRDLYRATFRGDDSDEKSEDKAAPKPKVKLPSEWTPAESEIPDEIEITHRVIVMCFFDEIEKLYSKREARPNLRPFELKILRTLRADPSIIIAMADKGLGPVAVEIHGTLTLLMLLSTWKMIQL